MTPNGLESIGLLGLNFDPNMFKFADGAGGMRQPPAGRINPLKGMQISQQELNLMLSGGGQPQMQRWPMPQAPMQPGQMQQPPVQQAPGMPAGNHPQPGQMQQAPMRRQMPGFHPLMNYFSQYGMSPSLGFGGTGRSGQMY